MILDGQKWHFQSQICCVPKYNCISNMVTESSQFTHIVPTICSLISTDLRLVEIVCRSASRLRAFLQTANTSTIAVCVNRFPLFTGWSTKKWNIHALCKPGKWALSEMVSCDHHSENRLCWGFYQHNDVMKPSFKIVMGHIHTRE